MLKVFFPLSPKSLTIGTCALYCVLNIVNTILCRSEFFSVLLERLGVFYFIGSVQTPCPPALVSDFLSSVRDGSNCGSHFSVFVMLP